MLGGSRDDHEYGIPYARLQSGESGNERVQATGTVSAESSAGDVLGIEDVESGILRGPKSSQDHRVKLANVQRTKRFSTSCIYKFFGILFFVVSILGVAYVVCTGTLQTWMEALEKMPLWYGPIVFTVLFTFTAFPMAWGYIILNLGAGFIYKFQIGLLIVMFSATVGAVIAFWVCSVFGRSYVTRKLADNEKLRAVLRVVEGRQGVKIIALMRLTPIPFGLQNACFSVTKISTFKYAMATALGLFPTQVLNTYIGTSLKDMNDVFHGSSGSLGSYLFLASQIGIGFGLSAFVFNLAKKELDRSVDDDGREQRVVLPMDIYSDESGDRSRGLSISSVQSHNLQISIEETI
eukprot:Nk52_evm6s356 gene=Nk52_evmTU6s356